MEYKVCKNCDAQNNTSALYCTSCHKSLKDASTIDQDKKIKHRSNPIYSKLINEVVSIGEWLLFFLGMLVVSIIGSLIHPILGSVCVIIYLIVVAVFAPKESMKNYCIASLVLIPIAIGLVIFLKGCIRCMS